MISNITAELPATMPCLTCFSPGAFERRTSKRGGIYFTCPLCGTRLFINNRVQAFGLLFWAKALGDPNLIAAARGDLERALARVTPETRPKSVVNGFKDAVETEKVGQLPVLEIST
jgi:hypothetical protein